MIKNLILLIFGSLISCQALSSEMLCDDETNIEPGHHFRENDFSKKTYESAVMHINTDEKLDKVELFTLINAQTIIKGYYLKKAAETDQSMLELFCHFLKNDAVIVD